MSVMHFDEIVFLDDFFRCADNTLQSHPTNRRFLQQAFGVQVRRLGIPQRALFARCEGGTLDVAAMMEALGLPRSPAGWAQATAADLQPLADAGLWPRLSAQTLVIGWGLPPSLLRQVDRAGASFVDLEIAPARFASHLAFCARSNDPRIAAALAAWRLDDEGLWDEAAVHQGYFARRGSSFAFARDTSVGLFCGQTALDLALVQDGRIVRPADRLDKLRELARGVDLLLIRPHPCEPDLRHLAQLAAQVPNVAWAEANIYALMCADNLAFVASLSSSVLREAPYFFKRAVPLIAPDRDHAGKLPAGCSPWLRVGPGIASLAGMTALCAGAGDAAVRRSGFPADALDRVFGIRWGFDPGSPGLRPLPTLALDRDYAFGTGQPATAWLSFGWSAAEPHGTWTEGERAGLVIPLGADASNGHAALRVEIDGELFVGASGRHPPIVRACANGQHARTQAAGGATHETRVRFELIVPAHEVQRTRLLVLEIAITDPQRPRDSGMGSDDRRLGLLLTRLAVRRNAAAAGDDTAREHTASQPSPYPAELAALRTARARVAPRARKAAIASVMAVACAGLFTALHWPTDASASATHQAEASRWTRIRHTAALEVERLREDLRSMLGKPA